MAILDVARAVVSVFPRATINTPQGAYSLWSVMVAIGGAETGGSWSNIDPGDPLSIYGNGGAAERPYSCDGYTSFSWPQVNLPANWDKVQSLSGISGVDPCGQAHWLEDYTNAAKVALAIYRSQGLGAWATWGNRYTPYAAGHGPYLQYLSRAKQAVESPGVPTGGAGAGTGSQPPQTVSAPSSATYTALFVVSIVIGALALGATIYYGSKNES